MKRLCTVAVILGLVMAGIPLSAAAATPISTRVQAEGAGRVSGTGRMAKGEVLPRYRARIRNANTGQISGETRTDEKGGFVFTGLNPGSYVVEFVSADGIVVATSTPISLAVGSMAATGVTVTVSGTAAGIGAAGTVTTASAGGGLFSSNAGILALGAAAGAGVLTIAKITRNASPSR